MSAPRRPTLSLRSFRPAPTRRGRFSPARSRRWRGRASTSSADGRARASARTSARRRSASRMTAAASLRAKPPVCAAISERTGTVISAAAVGVGARRSAAWSISVQSVSWPTAETSGIMLPAAARTTISSLKPHRSSSEPPPRATMMTSGRGIFPPSGSALKPSMARATSAAQVSPCTRTGHTITRSGKRSATRCRMSRMTAPVGEVMTPITLGRCGSNCLRASSNRPSAARRLRRSSSCASKAPTPAGSMVSTTIWYVDLPG